METQHIFPKKSKNINELEVQAIAVLQIPVRASRHGPLADFFQQTGPVLVREAV